MADRIMFLVILVFMSFIIWCLMEIYFVLVDFTRKIKEVIETDYKTVEKNAEEALAEEYDDKETQDSLFKTRDNKYSYKVFAENKKKQEKAKKPKEYIDDYEEIADKAERNNRYGR